MPPQQIEWDHVYIVPSPFGDYFTRIGRRSHCLTSSAPRLRPLHSKLDEGKFWTNVHTARAFAFGATTYDRYEGIEIMEFYVPDDLSGN